MEDSQTKTSTDEFEIIQMLRVYTRSGVDLKCVVIVRGILKQTIEGVEHLMREQEEEFSGKLSE